MKKMDTGFDTLCPTSEVVKIWMEKFTEGALTPAYLREWFSAKIPEFYCMEECGSMFRRFKSSGQLPTLTDYLEEFIYSGEKDRVNEFLQRTRKVTSHCGKAFKHGEPCYNCRECSTDNTCVMCAECFQKSQHRHHRYRMAVSLGGGYCDCGDIEAWKRHPSCEVHEPRPEADCAPPFPSDMHKRSKLIFSFMLQFSHEVINRFYSGDVRADKVLPEDERKEQYLLLLYNDEIHTFDQVINLLVQVIKCTPREGLELASEINKEGRAVVTASDFDTCSRLKSNIERLSIITGTNRFLEVHILPFQVVAHQCFALNSLAWMQIFLKTNQGFRSALIEVLEYCNPNIVSLLDKILVQDTTTWKSARTQWNELLCSVFLPDKESKRILAAHYLINYPKIMGNYLNDEEDHSFSTAGLSVQLFTVPSIAHELIYRHDAIASVIDFIIKVSTNDRNANGKLVFKKLFSRSFERACYLLYDVRYFLVSPPTSRWPDQLRVSFCRGMSSLFDFLGFIEGMDAFKRQLESHIEFEPEWKTAFDLQAKCFPVITYSLEWCASDEQALMEVFKTAIIKLKVTQSNQQCEQISINVLGSTFRCKKFDPSENAVTIHLTLTRYWGALYSIISRRNLAGAVGELPIFELIDPVVRTRAMIAQFRAGMWRKNGLSLSTQLSFYHDTKFRAKTLDMDILVLQIGASLIDSDVFLTNLAYDFGILRFILSDGKTTCELPETDINQLWALVDEFLYLLIVLIAERFQLGVGNVTSSDCMKHELIHVLALKPMSHSELLKAIGRQTEDRTEVAFELETVIKELTTFKLASGTPGKGQYDLKDPYQPTFNVFFYHFTKEMSFKTEQVQKELHKKLNGLDCCPPPRLPPFLEPFSKIINLLNCDTMLNIMKLCLDLWIKENIHGMDGHLHKILFLFGLAVIEEEESNKAFIFTEKAIESKIVNMMVDIYCSGRLKEHKDLMKWALQKYGKLAKDDYVEAAMFNYDEGQKNENRQSDARARAEAARAKIMANIKSMQTQFNKSFQESVGDQEHMETPASESEASLICILCQGSESIAIGGKTMVYLAFVQLSTVHMRNREPFTPVDLRERFMTTEMGPSPFISTCGHVMHADCWEAWTRGVTRSRAMRPHDSPFSHDPLKNEFLCPLCECISNVAMPILPSDILLDNIDYIDCETNLSFGDWLEITVKFLHVPGLSERPCAHNSGNTPQQDTLLQQSTSPGTPPQNKASHLGHIESIVGCNWHFGDKWVLHIKRLPHVSQTELQPDSKNMPTEKLNRVHAMDSEVFKVGTNSRNPLETYPWDGLMMWKTLAYTIHSLEASLRYSENPIFTGLTSREEACLENLIRITYVLTVTPRSCRKRADLLAIELLDMVVQNGRDPRCVLEWDCFGVLIGLLLAAPNLVRVSSKNVPGRDRFLLRLMLVSRIAQILISLDLEKYRVGSPIAVSCETECIPFLLYLLGHKCIACDTDAVWEEVKERLRPFLRCCSILFHYKQPKKFGNDIDVLGNDTFENLASYLQLPVSCKELFEEELTIGLLMTWGEHPNVRDLHVDSATSWKFKPFIKEIGTNRINTLVKLPQDYSELLIRVQDFSCSDVDDSQNPTMCLICGKILCSLSYCCQKDLNQIKVGACTFHAYECGAGVGIFLRIRKCQLIILAGLGRGCFKTAPYLDEHHEPDQGLKRGNKLLLCEESYRKLELSWINHNLYEMVTRSIEMGGFSLEMWHLF